jgi:hypothetical protein
MDRLLLSPSSPGPHEQYIIPVVSVGALDVKRGTGRSSIHSDPSLDIAQDITTTKNMSALELLHTARATPSLDNLVFIGACFSAALPDVLCQMYCVDGGRARWSRLR